MTTSKKSELNIDKINDEWISKCNEIDRLKEALSSLEKNSGLIPISNSKLN